MAGHPLEGTMGLVERRAAADFQERHLPALMKKVHQAAGFPLTVEVKWDTLSIDGQSDQYAKCWPDTYFEPLITGLARIAKDDMGRAVLKAGVKKVVIQNEADNGLKNVRGSVAMARTGDPHSATAQFFVNVVDNKFLDHTAKDPRGWGYAVFGTVTDGMDVVDKIKAVPTGAGGPFEKDCPEDPVVIRQIRRR